MKVPAIILLAAAINANILAQDNFTFAFLIPQNQSKRFSSEGFDSLKVIHKSFRDKLHINEKALLSGKLKDGRYLYLLDTRSTSQAHTWLADDPLLNTGLYRVELLPVIERAGNLCVSQDTLADRIVLTLVHYVTHITKFNVQDSPQLFREHDEHLRRIIKTGNVVWEGIFDNDDGGIMVVKGKLGAEVILSDPAVINGMIEPEIVELELLNGSFCLAGQ